MAPPKILLTNDDGWDAPGLAALKTIASRIGEVWVVAPRDPHSYAGHRVTTHQPLELTATGDREYHLSGTPADCVRVALRALVPGVDWVFSGINRGGNLGVDIYSSGTVAAAREAAILGTRALAVSQYLRRGVELDWDQSAELAAAALARVLPAACEAKEFWNINLPHLDPGEPAALEECAPDDEPLDVQFRRDESGVFHYSGTYQARPRTAGRDVERCLGGAVTISRLRA